MLAEVPAVCARHRANNLFEYSSQISQIEQVWRSLSFSGHVCQRLALIYTFRANLMSYWTVVQLWQKSSACACTLRAWTNKLPTPVKQGAAPDRLQLRLPLVPRSSLRFRRRVSLVVLLLARGGYRNGIICARVWRILGSLDTWLTLSIRIRVPGGSAVALRLETVPQRALYKLRFRVASGVPFIRRFPCARFGLLF